MPRRLSFSLARNGIDLVNELDRLLGALDFKREMSVRVTQFYLNRILPDCNEDNLAEVTDIVEAIFATMDGMECEIDFLRKQVMFLAGQIERIDEQLGNYDRGVSLQINQDPAS